MKGHPIFPATIAILLFSLNISLYGQDSAQFSARISVIDKLQSNDRAIAAFQLLLAQARIRKVDQAAVSILDHMGKRYFNGGNTTAMIRCEKEALEILQNHHTLLSWRALLLNNLGICYQSEGKYDSSLYVYQQAIQAQDSFRSKIAHSIPYLNLGLLYYRLRKYGPAEVALKKSLSIAERDRDNKMIAAAYLNLGSQYAGAIPTDSIKVAGGYLRKAISIAEKENYVDVLHKGYYALGLLAEKQSDTAAAIAYYLRCLQYPIGIAYDDAIPLVNLGHLYLGSKQYRKAEDILSKGLSMALQQIPAPDYIVDFYYYLAAVFQATGRYKKAAEYFQLYGSLADSLRGPGASEKVATLQAEFSALEHSRQVMEQELMIQRQQAVITRDRFLLSAVIFGIFLSSLIVFLLWRFQKEKRKKIQEMALRKAALNAEETERGRIAGELHNNVAVVLGTARGWLGTLKKQLPAIKEEEFQGALALLDTVISDVRATAHALVPTMLLTRGLAVAVEAYARQLEKATGIRVIFYYLGSIQPIDSGIELLLYRSIQELLQNAVHHSGTESILLQLSAHDTLLTITVEDRGKGMDANPNGFGLNQVRKNIEQLGGLFHLESKTGHYTSVVIEIDLNQTAFL